MKNKNATMKTLRFIFLSVILFTSQAMARLGEDLEQLRARYGREVSTSTDDNGRHHYHFRKNLHEVDAIMEGGKAGGLVISLRDGSARRALDRRMAGILIASNTPGVKMEVIDDKGPIVWEDKPATYRAIYFDHPKVPKLFISILIPPASSPAIE